MPQGILPFKCEEERRSGGMTGLGGLPTYLELSYVLGLRESIGAHVKVRDGGRKGCAECLTGSRPVRSAGKNDAPWS